MKVWYKSKIDNYTLKNKWIIFWDKINKKKWFTYNQSVLIPE